MTNYIFWQYDRWGAQLGTVNNVYSARHKDEINGEDSLTISAIASTLERDQRIVWRDKFGEWHEHMVTDCMTAHDGDMLTKSAFCKNSVYELTLEKPLEEIEPRNVQARVALQRVLEGTRWQVGRVDDFDLRSFSFYHVTPYDALAEIVDGYGAELSTTITVVGDQVTERRINLLGRRGGDYGQRFDYGRNLESITRTEGPEPSYSALIGYGAGIPYYGDDGEATGGYSRSITFAEINGGRNYVADENARLLWGIPDGQGGIKHSFGTVKFDDCEDKAELLALTKAALSKAVLPKISYQGSVLSLGKGGYAAGDDAQTGDGVYISDSILGAKLDGRVLCVDRDLLREENTNITLGFVAPCLTDELLKQQSNLDWLKNQAINWNGTANAGQAWLDRMCDSLNQYFDQEGGFVEITPGQGITIYNRAKNDNPTSAIQINGAGFRIANSRLPNGNWDWRTFGTGDGFTADLINVGILRCGDNLIDLTTGTITLCNGTIQDLNHKNFWNLATGEFRLSPDAQYLDGTIQDYFDGIENEINDVDKALGDLDTELRHVIDDGIITEAEAAAIAKLLQRVQTEQREAISAYNSVYGNSLLNGTSQKTTLLNAKNSLYGTDGSGGAYGTLVTRINQVIACTTAEQVKAAMENYNIAYAAYQSQRDNFSAALLAAERVISSTYADQRVNDLMRQVNDEFADVDEAMDNLDKTLTQAIEDKSISEAEAAAISKMLQRLEAEQSESVSAYTLIYESTYLQGDAKSGLKTAKDALYGTNNTTGSYGTLVAAIKKVIACTTAAQVDEAMAAYNAAYADYKAKRDDFAKALRTAERSIAQIYTDGAVNALTEYVEKEFADVDDAMGDLDKVLTQAIEDRSVSEAEAAAIAKMLQRLQAEQAESVSAYTLVYASSYLKGDAKTNLKSAKDALYGTNNTSGAYGTLVAAINKVIACTTADEVDTAMKAYNTAYAAYQTARNDFAKALTTAESSISDNYTDTTVTAAIADVNNQISDVDRAVEDLDTTLTKAIEDKSITEAESAAISKMLQRLNAEEAEAISAYTLLYNNSYLKDTTEKTALNTAYTALYGTKGSLATLKTAINKVLACKTADAVETAMESYNEAYADYQAKREAFSKAVRNAEVKVGSAYSDHAVDDFRQSVNKEFEDVRQEIEDADAAIRDYVSDEVITEAESAAISKMLQRIQSEQAEAMSAYNLVYDNANLVGTPKDNLLKQKENLYGKDSGGGYYNALVAAINAVIAAKDAAAVAKAMEKYNTAYGNYQTARAAFDSALRKAEQNIADNVASTKAQSAVNAQTQEDIFNKLTNGGKTEGIYLEDTHLYLNASYIKSGNISADIIKAGTITDSKGNNKWDLDTGELTTNKGKIGGYTISSDGISNAWFKIQGQGIFFRKDSKDIGSILVVPQVDLSNDGIMMTAPSNGYIAMGDGSINLGFVYKGGSTYTNATMAARSINISSAGGGFTISTIGSNDDGSGTVKIEGNLNMDNHRINNFTFTASDGTGPSNGINWSTTMWYGGMKSLDGTLVNPNGASVTFTRGILTKVSSTN